MDYKILLVLLFSLITVFMGCKKRDVPLSKSKTYESSPPDFKTIKAFNEWWNKYTISSKKSPYSITMQDLIKSAKSLKTSCIDILGYLEDEMLKMETEHALLDDESDPKELKEGIRDYIFHDTMELFDILMALLSHDYKPATENKLAKGIKACSPEKLDSWFKGFFLDKRVQRPLKEAWKLRSEWNAYQDHLLFMYYNTNAGHEAFKNLLQNRLALIHDLIRYFDHFLESKNKEKSSFCVFFCQGQSLAPHHYTPFHILPLLKTP